MLGSKSLCDRVHSLCLGASPFRSGVYSFGSGVHSETLGALPEIESFPIILSTLQLKFL
ncbi:MAG: hypothetical protein LBQ28_06040 [Prevotellaceae bacterium]|nr:hypothetical protein [Prevotellaceae bacterium]